MFDDGDDEALTVPAPRSSSHFSEQISRSAEEPELKEMRVGLSSPSSNAVFPGNRPVLLDTHPVLNQHGSGMSTGAGVDLRDESPESSAAPGGWGVASWLGWSALPPISRPDSNDSRPSRPEARPDSNDSRPSRPEATRAASPATSRQSPAASLKLSRGREPPTSSASAGPIDSREVPSSAAQGGPSSSREGSVSIFAAVSSREAPVPSREVPATAGLIDRRETPVNQGSTSYSSEPAPASQIGAPLNMAASMLEVSTGADGQPPEAPGRNVRDIEDDAYRANQDAMHIQVQRGDSSADWDAGEAADHGHLLPLHQVSQKRPSVGGAGPGRHEVEHHQSPIGRIFHDCVSSYARHVPARRPCCCSCCGIIVVIAITATGMILKPPEVETDFNSSTLRDGFEAALAAREGGRRLQGATLFSLFDLFITYELKEESGASSIFEKRVLDHINRFERKLTSLDGWVEYCKTTLEDSHGFCTPGLSVANYVMPHLERAETEIVPSKLVFNGQGKEMVPLGSTLRLLDTFKLTRLLLPSDYDKENPEALKIVRSAFRFKFYCCQSTDSRQSQKKTAKVFREAFDKFFSEVALPFLEVANEGPAALPFHIWYEVDGLQTMQVMQALLNDIFLAAGSMLFVLAYVVFHTRSVFLSFMGIGIVLFSVPFSYVVFAVTAGTQTMSIASFLSLFLIVGLGSDVIFVYTDFWRDSVRKKDDEAGRIVWTLFYAGKASLATTITTALSFFANLASVLKPLREFGTFMGLCVMLVWLLITLIFLPLCVVNERYFACCNIRCNTDRDRPSRMAQVLGKWVSVLFGWRRSCICSCFLLVLVALVFSIIKAETDTQLPDIFPPEHNQNRGKKTMQQFESPKDVFDALFMDPDNTTEVCNERKFGRQDDECALFWCEVNARLAWSEGDSACKCFWREDEEAISSSQYVQVVQRFIGRERLSSAQLSGTLTDHILSIAGEGVAVAGRTTKELAPILLQEWESGDVMFKPMVQAETTLKKINAPNAKGWQELCFCETYMCQLPETYRAVEDVILPRRLASVDMATHGSGRQLEPMRQTVATHQLADVAVVFGIDVSSDSPLLGERDLKAAWSFQEEFQMRQPWTQRNIFSFCENMPEELRAVTIKCFLTDFRKWLHTMDKRFPVPSAHFDSLAMQFAQVGLTGMTTSRDFVWVRNGEVEATYVSVIVDFSKHSAAEKIQRYKELWTKHLDVWNAQASRFARGAWHTSNIWVRAEAQQELIASTVLTLLIVLIMAFVGMLVFTFDPMLSFFVVASTLGVISGLFFFMTCVMTWAIGPIEVIALIVFIGYAVTYSLHITHKYGDGEALTAEPPRWDLDDRTRARYQRTGFALKSIGSAAVGSAATTCGCSVFLLFCTLTIFQKLGGVVLAVTLMSIAMALGPLPSALLIFGPLRPGKRCCPKPQDCEDFWSEHFGCCRGVFVRHRDRGWQQEPSAYSHEEGFSSAMPLADGHAVGHSHYGRGIEAERPAGPTLSDNTSRQVPPRSVDPPERAQPPEQLVYLAKSQLAHPRHGGQQVAPRSELEGRRAAAQREPSNRGRERSASPAPVKVDDLRLEVDLGFYDSMGSSGDLDIGSESVLDPIQVRRALPMGSIPQRSLANAQTKKPGGNAFSF